MTLVPTKLSSRQFLMLGEDPPGVRLELVHGEISVSPSPSFDHSHVEKHLSAILLAYIKAHDLGDLVGDVDTVFDRFNVRRPDIIFIAKARLKLLTKEHGIHFSPDLCVEILSPGSATTDQTDKFDLYARSGVAHYWLVDPGNQTFNAYKLVNGEFERVATGHGEDEVSAEPLAGLKISLAQIWPGNF